MKRFLVIAVMLLFGLAMVAQDGKDKKQGKKEHSKAGKSSDNDKDKDKDPERDEHGRKSMKFTQEGEFASVSTSTGPESSVTVNVSRGSSSTSPTTTILNFSSFQLSADNSTETVTNIFGEVPNSAFTGTTTKSLVLNLDTSTLDPATSSSTTCTFDLNAFTLVCGPGPLGTIHLEFHENGVQATRIRNLVEEDILGPVTTLIHASSDNGTADVQGSLFGVPVASSAASVGVNHRSTVEITRH